MNFKDNISNWTPEERLTYAKEIIEGLTNKICEVIDIHTNNEFIQYSDTIARQLDNTFAAHAFNSLQQAMFSQEIIRLLAIWDSPASNTISIPTAILLIDDESILRKLNEEIYSAHTSRSPRILNPSNDPDMRDAIEESVRQTQLDFAANQAERGYLVLCACVKQAKDIQHREEMNAIRNLRDKVSHSLTQTRREQKRVVRNVLYGEEKKLLEVSIRLIEDLYCWVNGTSFDIATDCVDISRMNAREFWMNCKFEIDR